MSIVDVIKGQYGPIPHSSFNMSLPVEAVDEFREALPSLTEMIVKAVEGPQNIERPAGPKNIYQVWPWLAKSKAAHKLIINLESKAD